GSAPGALTYTPAAGTVLDARNHQDLRVDAAATNNYNAAFFDVFLDVTRVGLYVTANVNSKTYGQTASDTGTPSGLVTNDGLPATFSSAGDAAAAPVGTGSYNISATLSDPNNKLGNYTVHETDATLTVSKATLPVNPLYQDAGAIRINPYGVTYNGNA